MLTVYSKTNCPACVNAKNLLNKYSIEFKEVKIDEDQAAKDFVLSEGHRQVPQIYNGNKLFVQGGWLGLMKMSESEIRTILYGNEQLAA